MNNNKSMDVVSFAKMAIVTALYVVVTVALGSLGSGAIQFRLSEMFNFLAFYNKRYVYSVTIGCVIANWMVFGPVDAVVGSASTYVFVTLGVKLFSKFMNEHLFGGLINKVFLYFSIFFAISMFTIALELNILYGLPFFATWFTTAMGEFISLIIGSVVIEALGRRIDLTK